MTESAKAFLAEIEAFLEASDMSESQFGQVAVNDRSLVRDLRAGRAPSLRLVDKVHSFMRSHSDHAGAA